MNTLHSLLVLLAIFCCASAAAADSNSPDSKSPSYYYGHFVAGEQVLWLGEVVDVNVYREQNDTVIEWLCKYLELAEPMDVDAFVKRASLTKKRPAIKVRKTGAQYFVSVMRSPDIPLEGAREAAAEMLKTRTYAIRDAATDFIGEFKGRHVVYVGGGGRGTVADNLKVIYVK